MTTLRCVRRAAAMLCAAAWSTSAVAAEPAPIADDPYRHSSGSWGQRYADQWAFDAIGVDAGSPPQRSVTVAIIDTGLDLVHPDVDSNRLWRNPNESLDGLDNDGDGYVDDVIGWNFVERNDAPWDSSGHGTLIAGIIGAATGNGVGIAGIAPDAKLMILKVANFAGRADTATIAAAITFATDHGADIVNLSLGGAAQSVIERRAIDAAQRRGVLIVTAAGNTASVVSRADDAPRNVLTVAAMAPDGTRARFSNFGTAIDLVAPGVDVLSLRARGTDFLATTRRDDYPSCGACVGDGYYRASGTSFAAAVVSGAAARILAARPNLDGIGAGRLLVQSARDIEPAGFDVASGYGALDVTAAAAANPDDFVLARIDDATLGYRDGRAWFVVHGEARAERFARANVTAVLGNGTRVPLGTQLAAPTSGVLAEVDFAQLLAHGAAAQAWTVELDVETTAGLAKTARFAVALPAASVAASAVHQP